MAKKSLLLRVADFLDRLAQRITDFDRGVEQYRRMFR